MGTESVEKKNKNAVITKKESGSKDYWLLDGSVKMDGSRKFNSVYREETE